MDTNGAHGRVLPLKQVKGDILIKIVLIRENQNDPSRGGIAPRQVPESLFDGGRGSLCVVEEPSCDVRTLFAQQHCVFESQME